MRLKVWTQTARGVSFVYSTHRWSRFKSIRPSSTLVFLTSFIQNDIWWIIFALCVTELLHLSHLWLRCTDMRTKAIWTGPRWVQHLLKAYGINTFSCRQILLHRWNMFSVSSSDKLFALQAVQPMHTFIGWCQIYKMQYRFMRAKVQSSTEIKIKPIKYAVCGKVIASPWWWAEVTIFNMKGLYGSHSWFVHLLFPSLYQELRPLWDVCSSSIHSHFKSKTGLLSNVLWCIWDTERAMHGWVVCSRATFEMT